LCLACKNTLEIHIYSAKWCMLFEKNEIFRVYFVTCRMFIIH